MIDYLGKFVFLVASKHPQISRKGNVDFVICVGDLVYLPIRL